MLVGLDGCSGVSSCAAQEREQLFYPVGTLHSLLPAPGHLYEDRVTHKLTGTQDRVAWGSLLVRFLLLMVLEVIVVVHCGGWACPVDMHLAHSAQERQTKSWIFTGKMFQDIVRRYYSERRA